MEMRQATLSAGMILLFAMTLFAQDSSQETRGLEQFEVTPAELPTGNNAWSVRIVRSGGFAGVTLSATLASDGKLGCASCASQPKVLSREDLLSILPSPDLKTALVGNSTVRTVKPGDKISVLPLSVCGDCFVTRVTLQHRDDSGNIETFFVAWDDVTAAGAPADIVRLANSIASLVK